MLILILIVVVLLLFSFAKDKFTSKSEPEPDCERVIKGYKCHQDYPGGCETCGRK